jgi:hypothetical protein
LAYASITFDRQPAAAAERRPAERTIPAIKPARARAPRRIHSQSRLVPELPPDAWELVGCVVTGGLAVAVVVVVTVTLGLGAVVAVGLVAVGLGEVVLEDVVAVALEVVELRLGAKLEIALLTVPPHPAARHPAARMAAERRMLLLNRRIPVPPCIVFSQAQGKVIHINDPAERGALPHPCWGT